MDIDVRQTTTKTTHGSAMRVAASGRYDFGRRVDEVGISGEKILPVASELNPLATHAPWGLVQAAGAPARVRRCKDAAAPVGVTHRAHRTHTLAMCVPNLHHVHSAAKRGEQPR